MANSESFFRSPPFFGLQLVLIHPVWRSLAASAVARICSMLRSAPSAWWKAPPWYTTGAARSYCRTRSTVLLAKFGSQHRAD